MSKAELVFLLSALCENKRPTNNSLKTRRDQLSEGALGDHGSSIEEADHDQLNKFGEDSMENELKK